MSDFRTVFETEKGAVLGSRPDIKEIEGTGQWRVTLRFLKQG